MTVKPPSADARSRMAETPCGSVHESPVRHLPHAPKRKAKKTKFRDWNPLLTLVRPSKPEALRNVFTASCRGAVPGRKCGLQFAVHFKRVT